jgi:hypothetical protein
MPDPRFDPTTNPDVQEALSRRYGNSALLVVPLSSGNFAIFAQDHQLERIMDRDDCIPENFEYASREAAKRLTIAKAARFYGEPGDQDLARDLKRTRRVPNMTQPTIEDLAIDL